MIDTLAVDAIAPGDHVVHLFSDEAELVVGAGTFLGDGLAAGGPVLVIATADRVAALELSRRMAGVDVDAARRDGRYHCLDAHETLARFLTADGPDAAAFDRSVGELVRSLAGGHVPLRVYGEMVALLWEAGAVLAAAALEELWNRPGDVLGISLYCAYPQSGIAVVPDGQQLVCSRHTHLVRPPEPPVTHPGEVRRRLHPTPYAVPAARHMLRDALTAWQLTAVLDDAQLVLAELVGNAVQHVGRRFEVVVTRVPEAVRLEVVDSGQELPRLRLADAFAAGGRGVLLVSRLSSRWGAEPHADGKVTWAEIAVPPMGTEGGA